MAIPTLPSHSNKSLCPDLLVAVWQPLCCYCLVPTLLRSLSLLRCYQFIHTEREHPDKSTGRNDTDVVTCDNIISHSSLCSLVTFSSPFAPLTSSSLVPLKCYQRISLHSGAETGYTCSEHTHTHTGSFQGEVHPSLMGFTGLYVLISVLRYPFSPMTHSVHVGPHIHICIAVHAHCTAPLVYRTRKASN